MMHGIEGMWIPLLGILAASVGYSDHDTAELQRFEASQIHMGSEFKIILYSREVGQASDACRAAFERIAELDRALSDYEPTSELNRLCDQAGSGWVEVSTDLYDVLRHAQALARASDGAFDVTIKPVVRLWRRAFRQHELPDPADLAAARALVGYQFLEVDPEQHRVRLNRAGMRLDLGGIAKGYASDQAQRVLHEHGITLALVAAAGDIVVSGPPPDAPGWRVAIAGLDPEDPTSTETLLLNHCAVSTSGDAARFAQIDGVRYSHIVDPRTGLGVVDRASVTVVAPSGWQSDSLATTAFLLGPEQGMTLIAQEGAIAGRFLRLEGETPRVWLTSQWAKLACPTDPPAALTNPDSSHPPLPD